MPEVTDVAVHIKQFLRFPRVAGLVREPGGRTSMNTHKPSASPVGPRNHIAEGVRFNFHERRGREPLVSVAFHPEKGLILVTTDTVAAGALLSSAILYQVPSVDLQHIARTDFYKFVFFRPDEAVGRERCGYIAFGPVSFCSHSDEPNAHVSWIKVGGTNIIELRAGECIAHGEEITMKYSNIHEYSDHKEWI